MIQDFRFPLRIQAEELDSYLAEGWYRMGQSIFTTDFVERDGVYFKTIWLRNCLEKFKATSSFNKLERRNKEFQIEIIPFNYNKQYEELFQKYRSALPPGRAGDLHSFLIGDSTYLIFNSLAINIYDSKNLI